jgi:p-hydroxybenzoate 3-monooxygenase
VPSMNAERTQVTIVGVGPAGPLLGRLQRAGIDSVVLEPGSRDHAEARLQAGCLERGTVGVLSYFLRKK